MVSHDFPLAAASFSNTVNTRNGMGIVEKEGGWPLLDTQNFTLSRPSDVI